MTTTEHDGRQVIVGRVTTGVGLGKHFTRLEWARQQFIDKLWIDPFPGTLNLIVDNTKSMSLWVGIKGTSGVRIDNRNGDACGARCFPVSIEGQIKAAIVLPEVEDYPPEQIEIIAAVQVREALGIQDGDSIQIGVRSVEVND